MVTCQELVNELTQAGLAPLAQYAWLSNSTAWRGYASFVDWNIKQGKASPGISFSHDWNEAKRDYGGFQVKTQYTAEWKGLALRLARGEE